LLSKRSSKVKLKKNLNNTKTKINRMNEDRKIGVEEEDKSSKKRDNGSDGRRYTDSNV
jgi:hypothetical protein